MNARPKKMTLLSLFLASLGANVMIGTDLRGDEPAKTLLGPVDSGSQKLSTKQERILDRVKKDAATIETHVANLASTEIPAGEPLVIALPGEKKITLKDYTVNKTGGGCRIDWRRGGDSTSLTFSGKSVVGLIYFGDKVYSVEPLSEGLHAVSQIDQTKFKDHKDR